MRTHTTNRTTRNTATLVGLVCVAAALIGSSNVGRIFSMRQVSERYSAEYVIGESSRRTDALEGTGTGGQTPVAKQEIPGAGDAEVQNLIQAIVGQPTANPNSNSNCGNLEARK